MEYVIFSGAFALLIISLAAILHIFTGRKKIPVMVPHGPEQQKIYDYIANDVSGKDRYCVHDLDDILNDRLIKEHPFTKDC
jgi:hypothetical protein